MSIVKDPTGIPLNYFAPADATALASEIKSGQTAYIGGGKVTGTAYTPAMMEFDGSTSSYSLSHTSSGNTETIVARFKVPTFSGDVVSYVVNSTGPTAYIRLSLLLISSDYSTLPNRRGKLQFDVQNSSGTTIAKLISSSTFLDDAPHTVFASYNAATAAFTFNVDGTNEDDTGNADRVSPTTGTLDTGASSIIAVGANQLANGKLTGQIGYVGYRLAYLSNPTDFMDSNGNPKALDESTWTEWGAQPIVWNPHGYLQDNRGSAGAMTANGTIIVGDGGST